MAVKLAFNKVEQFADGNGLPYSGAKLFTYTAGSATKQTTYTESTGTTPNTNPIVLDSAGRLPQPVWLTTGVMYKFVLAPSTDTDPPTSPIWTLDSIAGINDTAVSAANEWISGPAPTFVSTTSFTLAGDQTSTFHVSRRLKTTNTGGSIYSTIKSTSFAASVTTVVVVNDSGVLDSGLSAVSYGIASANNPSLSMDVVARKGTAVASAATTDIWGIAGDYIHVTGTTTITSLGTAPYAGARREIIFDGALTLTHNGTSLILPGAVNIFTAANDRAVVRADTTANMIVVDLIRASGLPAVGLSVPRSYLAGLGMSTAGSSATMTVAAGQATDSTNATVMNLASSLAKTTSAWAVGAAGGLDTGAIANSTWYHFWLITRTDTGVVDVLISLSASAPTMPTNYNLKRRIGSGKTNGSAQWTSFVQLGDEFLWAASVLDVNASNPGTSAVSRTLTVPTGVQVWALVNWFAGGAAATSQPNLYVSALDQNDEAPATGAAPLSTLNMGFSALTGTYNGIVGPVRTRTNTSAQVRTRLLTSDASSAVLGATLGWIDRRGQDS